MLVEENWRVYPYDSRYEVSDLGRVRKDGVLREFIKPVQGYYKTKINGMPQFIHRLVAYTFLYKYPFLTHVDHINRKKLDNRLCNLRWVTARLNGLNNDAKCYYEDKRRSTPTWGVDFKINRKHQYFGTYHSEEEAQHKASKIKKQLIDEELIDIERKKILYHIFESWKELSPISSRL